MNFSRCYRGAFDTNIVIWNNNIGRGLLDSKGLFPDEVKSALSVNRNAHAPVTESSKYGY